MAILVLFLLPSLLNKFGAFYATTFSVVLEITALLGLAYAQAPVWVFSFFIASFIFVILLRILLDIFIEKNTEDETTGNTRGLYLTFINIGFLIGPAIAGFILSETNYSRVYVASAVVLIPFLVLLFAKFRTFKDGEYKEINLRNEMTTLEQDKNLRNIILAGTLLQFFFAWMVVYMPIYLHEVIGFGFDEIGILFSIMLSAYLIFEYPLGALADKTLGEKEILSGGFVVIAVSLILISFTSSASFLLWAVLLFLTRVGAAMIESMCETYFFKHVNSSDTDDLATYRMTRPLSYIVTPLLASAFLVFFPFYSLFFAIALVMLTGLIFSFNLKDTK